VNPEGFLRDILAAPGRLAGLLDEYERPGSPLAGLGDARGIRRVVFIGMGSSRFAAVAVAAQLRSRGFDAVAELAAHTPETLPPRPGLTILGQTAE